MSPTIGKKLVIRKALPTDIDYACKLIYSVSPEITDYVLNRYGKSSEEFIRFAYKAGSGFFGFKNHTVAVIDDRVVGIAAFFSGKEYWKLGLAHLIQIIRFYGIRFGLSVIKRSMSTSMSPPGIRNLYGANLAVSPDFRSHGVGTALIMYHKEMAKSKNKKYFSGDVAMSNPRAMALYERIGVRVVKEHHYFDKKENITIHTLRYKMQL